MDNDKTATVASKKTGQSSAVKRLVILNQGGVYAFL